MKKLVFVFAAFVAMTFAACGNQSAEATTVNDSDSTAVVDSLDSCHCDSCICDSCDTVCCD